MTFLFSGDHSKIELTPEEMLAISQEISFKFSPNTALTGDNEWGVDTDICLFYPYSQHDVKSTNAEINELVNGRYGGFSAKDLYEISQHISRNFTFRTEVIDPELFLLPVDPYHLYVYWDIGENKKRLIKENNSEYRFTLRIYWRPDAVPETKSTNVWFDIIVDNPVYRQKVRLPIDDTAYSAALGKLNPDNSLDVLAYSNIIQVPPAPDRIRMLPHKRIQRSLVSKSELQYDGNQTKQDVQAADSFFDKTGFIDFGTKGVLDERKSGGAHILESGWYIKLHFGNRSDHGGFGTHFYSELLVFFKEKGIDIELIPDYNFLSSSSFQSQNASGQGILHS